VRGEMISPTRPDMSRSGSVSARDRRERGAGSRAGLITPQDMRAMSSSARQARRPKSARWIVDSDRAIYREPVGTFHKAAAPKWAPSSSFGTASRFEPRQQAACAHFRETCGPELGPGYDAVAAFDATLPKAYTLKMSPAFAQKEYLEGRPLRWQEGNQVTVCVCALCTIAQGLRAHPLTRLKPPPGSHGGHRRQLLPHDAEPVLPAGVKEELPRPGHVRAVHQYIRDGAKVRNKGWPGRRGTQEPLQCASRRRGPGAGHSPVARGRPPCPSRGDSAGRWEQHSPRLWRRPWRFTGAGRGRWRHLRQPLVLCAGGQTGHKSLELNGHEYARVHVPLDTTLAEHTPSVTPALHAQAHISSLTLIFLINLTSGGPTRRGPHIYSFKLE